MASKCTLADEGVTGVIDTPVGCYCCGGMLTMMEVVYVRARVCVLSPGQGEGDLNGAGRQWSTDMGHGGMWIGTVIGMQHGTWTYGVA